MEIQSIVFSQAQQNRLRELGATEDVIAQSFADAIGRNKGFYAIEKELVRKNRDALLHLLQHQRQNKLCQLRSDLERAFCAMGFTQVSTPTMISRKFLERMSIDDSHPLNEQVFWIDKNTCLRPMLAPNLYDVSKNLLNYAPLPLGVFEIGSCFRKESEGKSHLKEFTMINVVEWGTPMEQREQRLKELAQTIMDVAGIGDYQFEDETSVVYGAGLDVVTCDGLELASSSMGPHQLDSAWGIRSTWVGVGSGLERLLMHHEGANGIHRYARSIAYLNGARLSIK